MPTLLLRLLRLLRAAFFLTITACLVVVPASPEEATESADVRGIEAAVGDYVDSVYQVDPTLISRSIHPKLQKVGYYPQQDGSGYGEAWMNYYEFLELAAGYNTDGRIDPKTAPRKIQILDRLDATAVARLDAQWGIDFFQLAKRDGKWTIMNVIWQTPPPESFAKQSEEEASEDEQGIRQAALDYANSAYEVKPELIARSVHPHVQKVGYVHAQEGDGYRELWMNFTELQQLVEGWNVDHKRFDPATAKRKVEIIDRLDKIALARLDAEWGVDFFHLAKKDGRWVIMNVVWQVYPKKDAS